MCLEQDTLRTLVNIEARASRVRRDLSLLSQPGTDSTLCTPGIKASKTTYGTALRLRPSMGTVVMVLD